PPEEFLFGLLLPAGVGYAAGAFLAGLQGHPRRILGLVPFGTTALLGAVLALAFGAGPTVPAAFLGLAGGWIVGPLQAAHLVSLPPETRARGLAARGAALCGAAGLAAYLVFKVADAHLTTPPVQLGVLAGLAALAALGAWWWLYRE